MRVLCGRGMSNATQEESSKHQLQKLLSGVQFLSKCIMGKIRNSSELEIIPVSEINKPNQITLKESLKKRLKMQRMPYTSDPNLVPRVQKYLETNVDKSFVDITVMAETLQNEYREYSKRKKSAFRACVKKAYQIVLHNYGLDDQGSSSDEDLSDDSEQEENRPHENSMNDQMLSLYKRPQTMPKQIFDNELIDISSDDSEEESTYSNSKASNGPSTSQKDYHPVVTIHNITEGAKENANALSEGRYPANDRGKKRKSDYLSPLKHLVKKKKMLATSQESEISFKDVGGLDTVLENVCKLLIHIKHPELYKQIGITSPRGFLLHGPPGCGKTLLAHAIAGELAIPLLKVAAPELVAGVSGESEERIRELFERALASSPCVLFIDEIDAITPNRQNAQKEMERRIVAQLLSCLDDLNQNENASRVLVIGATNRPDAIDPALRRAGRFDREICLGIPDVKSRIAILKILTNGLKLSESFDFEVLANLTPGYVGADLLSLTREAAMVAVNRLFNDLKDKRKLEQAILIQKAAEAKEKLEKQKEEAAATTANEATKSDAEIVVDDDVPKEAPPAPVNGEAEAVVVIDDDSSKQPVDAPIDVEIVTPLNGNVITPDVADVEIDVSSKTLTTLEELILWLHDKAPVSQNEIETLFITMEDFTSALAYVQPSAKREGFATVPDTTWNNVGSLSDVREELQMAILAPVRHAKEFKSLGLHVPAGVLLCGPPGCGKTLLAKAIANEAGINFISVKGPELLNMYVGESERAVRVCFERARNSAPCVIFFDELDALCPKRSDSREGGSTMRVVNQMLTEMDGVEGRKGVFLLAASNRPDIIDPAVLRPGRLDKIIYVGLPTAADRFDILKAITKNGTQPLLAPDVDLEAIGSSDECKGYTGADLAALVREAAVVALKESMIRGDLDKPIVVSTEHFKRAVSKIRPSVTEKDQKHYEKLKKLYTAVPEQAEVEEMEI